MVGSSAGWEATPVEHLPVTALTPVNTQRASQFGNVFTTRVFVDAGYTINGNASGGAGYHMIIFEDAGFLAQNQAITIGANLSFNTFILAQRKAGVNLGGASFPGFASPATFTNARSIKLPRI